MLTKRQLEDVIKCGDGDINCRKCDMQMDCIVTMGCLTCKKIAQTALAYREMLERLEWSGQKGNYIADECPVCRNARYQGHKPYCELAALLRESEVEEG